jgi:ATP-binding cassette subfamily B (MDR/TAP) protein 6
LDTNTEKDIQKALQNLVKGRSSLSIAHRLSTIASADLILVLRDGQIVEQGTHKELLALDGMFAAMWADQVSTSSEHAPSIRAASKREPSGYNVDAAVTRDQDDEVDTSEQPQLVDTSEPNDDANRHAVPESSTIALPEKPTTIATDAPANVGAVAFPSPVAAESGSIIPSPGDPSPPLSATPPVAGVTFDSSSRNATPDPESEPKRKRISSQNFQKLARRISLTAQMTRRQASTSSMLSGIPGLKRDGSPRVSTDDVAARVSTDSPAGSIKDKKEKKEKKEKKRK